MKMGLRAVAVATLLMVLAFVAGCGREEAAAPQKPSSDGKLSGLVGIAMPTKSSERWIADGNNMVKQFQAKGLQTDLQYGQDDVQQQVSQIENMITKGAKVLVIAAIDGTSLTDVLQQAKDAGIKVVSYDRLIRETPNVDYYATFDNEHVGELQAGYIVDKLGLKSGEQGPFSIELFAGSPDDNNSSYFFKGAMSVLQPFMDKGQLQVKSGQTKFNQVTTQQWSGDKAQDRMENLLSKSYSSSDVDAVLSPYDGMSIGILSALKNVGYGSGSKPFPVVTGQDAEVASVKSILAGEQDETIYKDTRKLAATAVGMATAMLTGKTPTVNDTKSYDNGEKVVPSELLTPVSVTKDDVQEVLVDSGYIKESDLK